MEDLRIKKLAKLIVGYSLDVKKNEKVIIDADVEAKELALALYREVLLKGGHPVLDLNFPEADYLFYKHSKKHQLKRFPKHIHYNVKTAKKYVFVDTESNVKGLSDVDPEKILLRERVMEPITKHIFNSREKIRCCMVSFPCKKYAEQAGMSMKEYSDFVFSVCLQNWKKMEKQAKHLLKIFRKGKKVHLLGKGVDLKFEINGKKAEEEIGKENMPGGEIYMAPKKKSFNGWIKFDYPVIEYGGEIKGIFLRLKEGEIVEVKAEKNLDYLKKILKTDKNSGYFGEFGIGINKKINKFTRNMLFDEKLGGTIHFAFGMAYKENGGGNDSSVHVDILKDMKHAKLILDGKVVQERGRWKI